MSIDVAVSGDRNVMKKEAEQIPRYEDLTVEIERMWSVNTNVTPVVTGNWTHVKIMQKIPQPRIVEQEIRELQARLTYFRKY
jgi:hypothetical protein